MSTTPIRFLLVVENLRDRSLYNILRREGHEVGFLVPYDSDLSQYPLPADTPIMTVPDHAVNGFDPTVIVFPTPYVGPLASELIKQKRWVVGSSNIHHELAALDPKYTFTVMKTSGTPHLRPHYVEDAAEMEHILNLIETSYAPGRYVYTLSFDQWNTMYYKSVEELRFCARFFDRTPARINVLPRGEGYSLADFVLFFSGKHRVPEIFAVQSYHSHTVEHGLHLNGCGLSVLEPGESAPLQSSLKDLSAAMVSMRYTGPLFVQCIEQDRKLVAVSRLTSTPPDGFWAALWGLSDFRDGFANYFLHTARHTLKAIPYHLDEDGIGHASAVRQYLAPAPFRNPGIHFRGYGMPYPVNAQPPGMHIPEDVIDGVVRGVNLGWVVTRQQDDDAWRETDKTYIFPTTNNGGEYISAEYNPDRVLHIDASAEHRPHLKLVPTQRDNATPPPYNGDDVPPAKTFPTEEGLNDRSILQHVPGPERGRHSGGDRAELVRVRLEARPSEQHQSDPGPGEHAPGPDAGPGGLRGGALEQRHDLDPTKESDDGERCEQPEADRDPAPVGAGS